MRWKSDDGKMQGKTRTVIRFAWLPVKTIDNQYVWLERYKITQEWIWRDISSDYDDEPIYEGGDWVTETVSTLN